MELKKLHMGTIVFGYDAMDEVAHLLSSAYQQEDPSSPASKSKTTGLVIADPTTAPINRRKSSMGTGVGRTRRDMSGRVREAVVALATCHNVTPVTNDDGSVTYQASSPDEVAIVEWTESVGLRLAARDRTSMTLRLTPPRASNGLSHVYNESSQSQLSAGDSSKHETTYDILLVFPFTSESKRMGIILRSQGTGEIVFVQKGADTVMAKIVQKNDWLDEECGNMAREGLRTLVVGRKKLSPEALAAFEKAYKAAQLVTGPARAGAIQAVVGEHLERDLELLGLTGVEDKLQEDVKSTLELLRNAGLKIWMLTGDKVETARNIAVSSKLVGRGQYMHTVAKRESAGLSSLGLSAIGVGSPLLGRWALGRLHG